MATIRLRPSEVIELNNTHYLTLTNEANIYDNDDTTYGQVNHTRTATYAYYLSFRNFNFSAIPSNATISSATVTVIANVTGASSNKSPMLVNDNTVLSSGSSFNSIGTSKTTTTSSLSAAEFSSFKNFRTKAGVAIQLNRSNKNTASNMKIYEIYIDVEYTTPEVNYTITSTLSGNGTISPSGATTITQGNSYTLTITPTNSSATVSATKNGTSISLTHSGNNYTYTYTPNSNDTIAVAIVESSIKKMKIGSLIIDKFYLGSTEVNKIYIGSNLVYEK